jgi:hypothetical protein
LYLRLTKKRINLLICEAIDNRDTMSFYPFMNKNLHEKMVKNLGLEIRHAYEVKDYVDGAKREEERLIKLIMLAIKAEKKKKPDAPEIEIKVAGEIKEVMAEFNEYLQKALSRLDGIEAYGTLTYFIAKKELQQARRRRPLDIKRNKKRNTKTVKRRIVRQRKK